MTEMKQPPGTPPSGIQFFRTYLCSVCGHWVPDYRAYRYGERLYCDADLPTPVWAERMNDPPAAGKVAP